MNSLSYSMKLWICECELLRSCLPIHEIKWKRGSSAKTRIEIKWIKNNSKNKDQNWIRKINKIKYWGIKLKKIKNQLKKWGPQLDK
jgi:hypothetical protein